MGTTSQDCSEVCNLPLLWKSTWQMVNGWLYALICVQLEDRRVLDLFGWIYFCMPSIQHWSETQVRPLWDAWWKHEWLMSKGTHSLGVPIGTKSSDNIPHVSVLLHAAEPSSTQLIKWIIPEEWMKLCSGWTHQQLTIIFTSIPVSSLPLPGLHFLLPWLLSSQSLPFTEASPIYHPHLRVQNAQLGFMVSSLPSCSLFSFQT